MAKTTHISISQVEGKKPIAMIESYEDGAFVSRSSKELSVDSLISLIFELYDIEPNRLTPKQKFKCVWCHKHFAHAMKSCDRCGSDVQKIGELE